MISSIEKQYVYNSYQIIAKEFSATRTYIWKSVKIFLDSIKPYSIIAEIGSGNGKNLLKRTDCINLAFDFCSKFTEISQNRGIDSIIANNLSLPIKTNSVDYVLSVAILHHFSTEIRRINALKELIRILKPKGKLFIEVWALEQPKIKYTKSDNYIEFNNPDKSIKVLRFYHLFKKNELESIVKKINNIKILQNYYEFGNWIIILQKTL